MDSSFEISKGHIHALRRFISFAPNLAPVHLFRNADAAAGKMSTIPLHSKTSGAFDSNPEQTPWPLFHDLTGEIGETEAERCSGGFAQLVFAEDRSGVNCGQGACTLAPPQITCLAISIKLQHDGP